MRNVLLAVMKHGSNQEKKWAGEKSEGELRQDIKEGRTGSPGDAGVLCGQWQEALRARTAQEGDLSEIEYLHEEWEERYPAVAGEGDVRGRIEAGG